MPSLTRSRPVTRGDDPQLKRRLERVWLLLKLPMATRLAFLQKYASVEHAPRLEQAVGLWERAAEAYPRLAKLRRVEARLATGELFQAQDFVRLLRGILVKGDPAPPASSRNRRSSTPTPRRRAATGAPRRRGSPSASKRTWAGAKPPRTRRTRRAFPGGPGAAKRTVAGGLGVAREPPPEPRVVHRSRPRAYIVTSD